ncbi:MAG: Holliday junction branch migration protein RuvA [Microthrixaceae bacterium]
MIGSLRGTLLARGDGEVTVEVGGIGYRVLTTPGTVGALGPEGSECFVWVHHHLREDAQTLYGFARRSERDVFETLIGTHGVGPSLGRAIQSTHSPDALGVALANDDVAALCLVPGVGPKTAKRLLVELKSRLDLGEVDLRNLGERPPGSGGVPTGTTDAGTSARNDVREALASLGYHGDEINRVLTVLPPEGDAATLLREALGHLAVA